MFLQDGYVFLPACCSCCVASSPLYVSPGCLDAHWTRPFVPGCTAVVCLPLQPAHRYLGHELGDGHGVYVRGTCFCPPVAPAALPPHRFVYPLDVSTLTGHRPFVPGCTTVECRCLQPAHRYLGHELGDGHGVYVRGTCFCPPVAPAALPPHRFVYVLDVSTLTDPGHSSLDVLL